MYDKDTVLQAFRTLVGFRQHSRQDIPQLGSALLASTSGRFFNEAGNDEMLTTANLYEAYDADEYPTFDAYLEELRDNVILFLVHRFTGKKVLQKKTKELVDREHIFETSFKQIESVNDVRFFGWRVKPIAFENVAIDISRVAVSLTSDQPSLTLYLFHSSKKAAIATLDLSNIPGNDFSWNATGFPLLHNVANEYKNDGEFYLGFYGDEVAGNIMSYRYDFLNPCITCGKPGARLNYKRHRTLMKFCSIVPFTVSSEYFQADRSEVFDTGLREENLRFFADRSLGLTCEMSARIDITKLLVDNREMFTEALISAMAYKGKRQIYGSTQDTPNLTKTAPKAFYDISGQDNHMTSRKYLDIELDRVAIEFDNLGSPFSPDTHKKIERKVL